MGRSSFKEQKFRCCICGAEFKALTGGQPAADPVCMSCGLRYSPEKRRELVEKHRRIVGTWGETA